VVKVGAKAGTTVGILQSMSSTTIDTKSSVIYKDCFRVTVSPFAVNFAKVVVLGLYTLHYWKIEIHHIPTQTLMFRIGCLLLFTGQATKNIATVMTPLTNAIQSLIDAKKLPEDLNIKMLHQVFDILSIFYNKTSIDASTVDKFSNIL
jgi:hypothetical protein